MDTLTDIIGHFADAEDHQITIESYNWNTKKFKTIDHAVLGSDENGKYQILTDDNQRLDKVEDIIKHYKLDPETNITIAIDAYWRLT